jgi:Protein related to penicillin acylase
LLFLLHFQLFFFIPPYVLRFADPFQGPMKAVARPPPPVPVENYVLVVKAGDEREAFYKLGYAHAYYRLFQMDVMRRVVEGRLSELLGEAALDTDIYFSLGVSTRRLRRHGFT